MELTDTTMLTPALRFDHHSIVGNNGARPQPVAGPVG